MKQQRIQALTGVRTIAAVMVFLYHNRKYWRSDIPEPLLRFFNEFHTGVSLFFVLSGFLIAYTYKDNPLISGKEYSKYLIIRFIRIFPVYLLILTVMYLDNGFVNRKETLLTYTLLHGFSDQYNLHGLPQAWSLTVELCFYIAAPFIYFFTKRNIAKTFFYLLSLLFITLLIGYGLHWLNGNKDRFLYPWFFVFNTTFAGRFMEFFAGVLLAHHLLTTHTVGSIKLRHKTLIGGIGIFVVIYCISLFEPTIYMHGTDSPIGLALRNIVFPFAVVLFLYGLITEKTWIQAFLSSPVMVLLGNASYIFYLVHIGYVNLELRKWHYFPDRNFILLWLFSIAVYLLIERPVYKTLKNWVRKW